MTLLSQKPPHPPRPPPGWLLLQPTSRKCQERNLGRSQRRSSLRGGARPAPAPRSPPGLLPGLEIARLFVSVAAVACGRADARLSAPTLLGLLLTSPWAAINPEFLYLASGFPRAALSPARNYSCWDLPLSRRILEVCYLAHAFLAPPHTLPCTPLILPAFISLGSRCRQAGR